MIKKNLYFFLIFFIFISFSTTEQISYSSAAFKESIKKINNPDRGFYKAFKVTIGPESFVHDKITDTNKPDQIYHFRCDISAFSGAVNSDKKDKELTDTALNLLDTFLSYIKEDNKNAVIRFSYDVDGKSDSSGNYYNREPSLETIEKHIKQLSKILNKYVDTLTAIEAGMLGPWGEMHGTKLATEENKAKVFKWWLQNTNKIPILARTPKAMLQYFGKTLSQMEEYEIKSTDEGYYLGLFNDCYLSSSSDQGTYSDRKKETQWLSTQNEHLPYGGETCAVYELSDLDKCIPEMKLLKLNYLNGGFKEDVMKKWKNAEITESLGLESLYNGMSGFDYIERHLGYRLLIKSVNVDYETYGSYKMKINLKNVGFGNLFKSKKVDIIYVDMDNKEIYRKTVISNYTGELKMEIKDQFLSSSKSSEYKVYLSIYGSIEDKVVYYPVILANENIYEWDFKGHLLFYVKKGVVTEP